MKYEAPAIKDLGSVQGRTAQGEPNERFDALSFIDFAGPKPPTS